MPTLLRRKCTAPARSTMPGSAIPSNIRLLRRADRGTRGARQTKSPRSWPRFISTSWLSLRRSPPMGASTRARQNAAKKSSSALRSNRILLGIADPGIVERAGAVHFRRSNVGIPVGDGAKTCPGVEVDARQPQRWRDQCAGPLAVRAKSLSVFIQFRIKATGTPARKDFLKRRHIHTKQVREGNQVGSQGHDGTHVQVAVGPAVQPLADSRSKRVVHGGMTESALKTHRAKIAALVKKARHKGDRKLLLYMAQKMAGTRSRRTEASN